MRIINHSTLVVSFCSLILFYSFSLPVAIDSFKIEKAPELKKGTFWKSKFEQVTDYKGQKSSYITTQSCYIDNVTSYKGIEVYEATVLFHEEHKIIKFFIERGNLKLTDAIGFFTNRMNDTVRLSFDLLNFPLFKDKKWESICQYQEFPNKPITEYKSKFEVVSIIDTSFKVDNAVIKTKAFSINIEMTNNNKTTFGNYLYLSPSDQFPGSCPVFLWSRLLKTLRYKDEQSTKLFPTDSLTNFHW